MDYLEFFHLQEDPFGLTPDSFYFYPSKMHNDVLASLDYAVDQKEGFSLVIGEPGTGKTTILKIFIDRWKEKAEIALIMTPRLSPEELLQAVLDDLKIQLVTANKNDMLKAFRDFLIDRSLAGKRVIIIVDEAQNLSDASLEELRLLSNLETEKEKLLQIILVGQPELQRRLQSEGLRQLDQRITIRVTLRALTLPETSDYIAFRLVKAGKGSAILNEKVKKAIYKISGGIPRLVNLITSRAMMVAYIGTAHQIEKKHVLDAAKHVLNAQPKRIPWQKLLGYVVSGLLAIFLIFGSVMIYGKFTRHITPAALSSGSDIKSETPVIPAGELNPPVSAKNHKAEVVHPSVPKTQDTSTTGIYKSAIVTVHAARLRERPSLQANIERVVSKGETLEVMDEWTELSGNKWYKVKTRDGKESWIASYIVRITSL
jgi:type II secretory pathway predicted ATPase ExeA